MSHFRVGGFNDENIDAYGEPVQVTCRRCGTKKEFTWRDDGGADRTEDLDVLVAWATAHVCPRQGAG